MNRIPFVPDIPLGYSLPWLRVSWSSRPRSRWVLPDLPQSLRLHPVPQRKLLGARDHQGKSLPDATRSRSLTHRPTCAFTRNHHRTVVCSSSSTNMIHKLINRKFRGHPIASHCVSYYCLAYETNAIRYTTRTDSSCQKAKKPEMLPWWYL